MTREQFLQLDETEQNKFIAKLIHALRNNNTCFEYADWIVQAASKNGLFDNVKFGAETYPEVIGVTPPLS